MLKSIACALVLTSAVPAAATPGEKNEVVRFDDLNLASPAGVATLERRLNSAARRVCDYHDGRGLSQIMSKDYQTCLANALAGARQQIAAKTVAVTRKG